MINAPRSFTLIQGVETLERSRGAARDVEALSTSFAAEPRRKARARPRASSARKERSRPWTNTLGISPEEGVLLYLSEAAQREEVATQGGAASALGWSQPTVSRALSRLEARGLLRTRWQVPVQFGGREITYHLTSEGASAAQRIVGEAYDLPWPEGGLAWRDVVDLLPGLSLTDLVADLTSRKPDSPRGWEALEETAWEARAGRTPSGAEGAADLLVGRVSERLALLQALKRAVRPSGHGQVLVFLGPAGQGKTRLLQYAETVARRRGFRVVHGSVLKGSGLPFSPFDETLQTLGSRDPGGFAGWEGRTLSERMLAYLNVLAEGASKGPLLVVVDDLHWAEPSALAIFRFLCHNLPTLEGPVLLLAAARDDEPHLASRMSPFDQILEDLRRGGSALAATLVVPPLTARESRVVADRTGAGAAPVPPRVVERVLERARGNPLFILEGLRDLRSSVRTFVAPEEGTSGELRVPSSLHRLLESRLEKLPAAERALLEAGALLGEEFSSEPLEALARSGALGLGVDVARGLRDLADERGLLTRRAEGRFAFVHVLFQEALQEITPDRARWSGALARWWEVHRREEVVRIAQLYRRSGDQEQALPWLRRALAAALRDQAYESTEELVEGMREAVRGRPRAQAAEVEEELDLLKQLWFAGSHPVAERIARGLVTHASRPRDRALGSCYLLVTLVFRDPAQAERRLRELPRNFGGLSAREQREVQGAAEATAAYLHSWWGDPAQSLAEADRALKILRSCGSSADPWVTSARVTRCASLLHLGRYREALKACRETLPLTRSSRATVLRAQLLDIEALAENLLGKVLPALHHREEAVRAAREAGNHPVLARLLCNLSLSQLRCGRKESARRSVVEFRELVDRFQLPNLDAWARYREGQVLWFTGRSSAARESFLDAVDRFRRGPVPVGQLLPQSYLITTERDPRKVRSFLEAWDQGRPGLDTEEVSVVEPILQTTFGRPSGRGAPPAHVPRGA
jgi:tetratricopeptide (TPR) repeat protein/DNA-binding MarR family transcriptional regulator